MTGQARDEMRSRGLGRFLRQNAIGLLALFVALSGTSYAAITLPRNSVGTTQLKQNAVTGPKIKKGAVTAAKINFTNFPMVPAADFATEAATAGYATAAGSAAPRGDAGGALSGAYPNPSLSMTYVRGPITSIAAGGFGTPVATCPTGSTAIAGGYFANVGVVISSEVAGVNRNSWSAFIRNDSANAINVYADAICASSVEIH